MVPLRLFRDLLLADPCNPSRHLKSIRLSCRSTDRHGNNISSKHLLMGCMKLRNAREHWSEGDLKASRIYIGYLKCHKRGSLKGRWRASDGVMQPASTIRTKPAEQLRLSSSSLKVQTWCTFLSFGLHLKTPRIVALPLTRGWQASHESGSMISSTTWRILPYGRLRATAACDLPLLFPPNFLASLSCRISSPISLGWLCRIVFKAGLCLAFDLWKDEENFGWPLK